MNENYEVTTNFGGGYFENEHDAIIAFSLVAHYHDVSLTYQKIKDILDKHGYYEVGCLSIRSLV